MDETTPVEGLPFETVEFIGEGVYSRVYRARRNGEKFAIKIQEADGEEPESVARRFLREGATLARLDHPTLPRVRSIDQYRDRTYLVMNLVDGRPLDEHLESGGFDEEQIIQLGRDVTAGLSELHGAGLVHRDIKPSNIVWNGERASIIDFGLVAKTRRTESTAADSERIVGTFTYASPEQLRALKRPVGPQSDLYSVGAVLYECCTGAPPFDADSVDELLELHASEKPTPTAERAPEISDELAELVDGLLQKEPSARPGSAGAVHRELDSEHLEDAARSSPIEPGSARRRRLFTTGRGDVIARACTHWSRFGASDEGGCLFVRASPGQGGAEFLQTIVGQVREDATVVLQTTDRETDARPLHALRELLEQFVASPVETDDETTRSEQLRQTTGDLDLSVSTRRLVRSVVADPEVTDDETVLEAEQFYGEIARLIGELDKRFGPMALVVECIGTIDSASRDVLRRLTSDIDRYGIWVCATFDPTNSAGANFADTITTHAELGREYSNDDTEELRRWKVVELAPLSIEAVETFVRRYLDAEVDDQRLIDQLAAVSGRAPVILEQLLDILVTRGIVRPDWDSWEVDHDALAVVDFPDNLHDLLTARLETLPDPVSTFCRNAAVWGRRLWLPAVAAASEISEEEAQGLAETATQHGLLERDDGTDQGWKFAHESVRHSLSEDLSEKRRRALHQSYAEWLDDRREGWSFRLARHYRDGDGSLLERQLETTLEAGKRAAENFDYETARSFLETADEATDATGETLSWLGLFRLGESYQHLEELDLARETYRRAAQRADNDLERAKCQLAQTQLAASRIHLAAVDDTVRDALATLDAPIPERRFGIWALALYRFLVVLFWRHVYAPSPVEEDERERQILRSKAYQLVGNLGNLREDRAFSALELTGRLHATLPLGASMPLLRTYSSAVLGRCFQRKFDAAERNVDDARQVAEEIGTERAHTYVDTVEAFLQDMTGSPGRAAARHESILRERGDHLSLYYRSLTIMVLIANHSLRGGGPAVGRWLERWKALQKIDVDEYPPGSIWEYATLHARFRGEDEQADRYRRAARESFDDEEVYLAKKYHGTVMLDEVLQGGSVERIEQAIDDRRELGLGPSENFYSRSHHIYLMYARRYIADETEDDQKLEGYEHAVAQLRRSAHGHPTFLAHANVGQADLHHRRDDRDEAFAALGRAESLALRHDNDWVRFEVDRLRAEWLGEQQLPRPRRSNATSALQRAEEFGWVHFADQVREEFRLDQTDEQSSRTPTSSTLATIESTTPNERAVQGRTIPPREYELERKLDALLEVSAATSSIIDPDEVAQVVVDAAIRVLGAQRGMLFLSSDPSVEELADTDPDVVESLDDEPDPNPTFSRTVLEEVASSGEPMVLRSTLEGADIGAGSVVAEQMRSIVAAPLWFEDELLGVIYLDNHLAEGVFDTRDTETLQAMANHIPIALETARSAQLEAEVAAERERRAFAEDLREFTRTVNSMMDVTEILTHLIDELADLESPRTIAAAHVQEDGLELECAHRAGELRTAPFDAPFDENPGEYVASVVDSGSSRLVSEVNEEDCRREPWIWPDAATWLAVPVGSGDRTVGVVTLADPEPHQLDSTSLEQVVALTSQAGVAIEKTELATIDPLTGLYNRRKFFEAASEAWEHARRNDRSLAALMIDFDDFKAINDRHGHAVGDTVLETAAERCRKCLRATDAIGRYGGDEFAAVLEETDGERALEKIVPRLEEAIGDDPIDCGDREVDVSVSIGTATIRARDDDVHDTLERADAAVFAAKRAGRGETESDSDSLHSIS